jgi:hypothetical protein
MYHGFFNERIELIMEIIIIAASPLPFLNNISFYFSNDFVDGEVLKYLFRYIIMQMNFCAYLWLLELSFSFELLYLIHIGILIELTEFVVYMQVKLIICLLLNL